MIYAKLDVDILDHPRALAAGRDARDLWIWSVLYARKHQTDGEIPIASVLASSWGLGGKKNGRLADRLVAVGLWERTDDGFRVLRYAAKNDTKQAISERQRFERERKADRRSRSRAPDSVSSPASCPTGTTGGTPTVPPGSGSGSGSDQVLDLASGELVVVPDWWAGVLGVIEQTGVTPDPLSSWLRYSGHRAGKSRPTTPSDAIYWLTTVIVREALEERERLQHRADREAKWDAQPRPTGTLRVVPDMPPAPYHGVNRKADAERDAWAQEAGTPAERAAASAAALRALG
jgi:hypothetical protein